MNHQFIIHYPLSFKETSSLAKHIQADMRTWLVSLHAKCSKVHALRCSCVSRNIMGASSRTMIKNSSTSNNGWKMWMTRYHKYKCADHMRDCHFSARSWNLCDWIFVLSFFRAKRALHLFHICTKRYDCGLRKMKTPSKLNGTTQNIERRPGSHERGWNTTHTVSA